MKELNKIKNISRRKFIGQASCFGVGATLFSSLINLKALNAASMANSQVLASGDYKALVCLYKSGGNDSFNMLVPMNNDEYNHYSVSRSNLALSRDSLLAINPVNTSGRQFGLHPSMSNLQQIFNSGDLAFVSNIGTLVEPVNKQQVYEGSTSLPLGLFSHADQSQQWQTAHPHVRSIKGWGGRIADLINDMNDSGHVSMNISLAGRNIFQNGSEQSELSLHAYNGATGILGYGDESWNGIREMQTKALDNMLEKDYQDVFKKSYVDVVKVSRDASIKVQEALDNVGYLNTAFTDNYISKSFEMVARMIKAREELGFKRQVFFIDYGGWDHHDELLGNQNDMLSVVDQAMGEFYQALGELDMRNQVTTFSISEFSRTLTSNGNGTDHGWGGNVMVMGGDQLNGQRIFGEYPSLELDNNLMLWNGVLIPSLSADTYFAELARWFEVPDSELSTIFPNLENFYDVNSGQMPVGFLNL